MAARTLAIRLVADLGRAAVLLALARAPRSSVPFFWREQLTAAPSMSNIWTG